MIIIIYFIQLISLISLTTSIQSQSINDLLITTEFDERSTIINDQKEISTKMFDIQTESNEYSTIFNNEMNLPTKKFPFENQQKWFNLNENSKKNKSKLNLLWKYQNDQSNKNSSYRIEPDKYCLNQMCSAQLKYIGLIQKNKIGCLSFLLEIQGQPVGHLWIEENKEKENLSQKILLSNKTLRIEHSIKSNLKMLIIQAKILFRNFSIDRIKLSNLNLQWKGSCPKSRQGLLFVLIEKKTKVHFHFPLEDLIDSFLETTTIHSNDYSTNWSNQFEMITSENDFDSFENLINENDFIQLKTFSFFKQSNFKLFLSLITTFCLLIMILPSIYGLWTIRYSNYLLWNIPIHYQIQFIARRSLRSSTRSDQKLSTISQIVQQLMENDFNSKSDENSFDKQINISILTNSDVSTFKNTYL